MTVPRGGSAGASQGRDDTVQFGSPRPQRRPWPRWLPILGLVVVAVTVVTVVTTVDRPAKPSPVAVTELGHRLLGVRAAWALVGRGPREVVVIELARGRLIRTRIPALLSTGPVSFIAGRAQVIIRPLDSVPGYLIAGMAPARPLPGWLSRGGPVVPGPRSGQFWIQGGVLAAPISLARQDGIRSGPQIAVPAGGPWLIAPDGNGYPLLNDINGQGVYDARPGVLRRVTAGMVVAAGPGRWLTVACQRRGRCSMAVVSSATGASHVISRSPAGSASLTGGVIAPDGSRAAVFWVNSSGPPALHLIDLASGADYPAPGPASQAVPGASAAVWSPDSRWLFVVADGKLLVVDARTRRLRSLGVTLPRILQVAIESGPSA